MRLIAVRRLAGVRSRVSAHRGMSDRLARAAPTAKLTNCVLVEAASQDARARQGQYSTHARVDPAVDLRPAPRGLEPGCAVTFACGRARSIAAVTPCCSLPINDVHRAPAPEFLRPARRPSRELGKVASYERRTVKPVHLLIDSGGLSVHVGQLRTPPKARDYRKLHLAVDEQTSDVVACDSSRASGLETLPGWRHSSARSSVPSPRPRPTPRTTPATSIRRWRITVLIDRRRC